MRSMLPGSKQVQSEVSRRPQSIGGASGRRLSRRSQGTTSRAVWHGTSWLSLSIWRRYQNQSVFGNSTFVGVYHLHVGCSYAAFSASARSLMITRPLPRRDRPGGDEPPRLQPLPALGLPHAQLCRGVAPCEHVATAELTYALLPLRPAALRVRRCLGQDLRQLLTGLLDPARKQLVDIAHGDAGGGESGDEGTSTNHRTLCGHVSFSWSETKSVETRTVLRYARCASHERTMQYKEKECMILMTGFKLSPSATTGGADFLQQGGWGESYTYVCTDGLWAEPPHSQQG